MSLGAGPAGRTSVTVSPEAAHSLTRGLSQPPVDQPRPIFTLAAGYTRVMLGCADLPMEVTKTTCCSQAELDRGPR